MVKRGAQFLRGKKGFSLEICSLCESVNPGFRLCSGKKNDGGSGQPLQYRGDPVGDRLFPSVLFRAVPAEIARAVEAEGADSVSLINTLMGMAIDIEKRRPMLSIGTGGLSGPAVKPVALRMVWQVAKAVKIPVIGLGGICNARDAIEFIMAGATAIEIGTANFIDPEVTVKVRDGINEWLDAHGCKSVREIIGALE